MFKNINNIMLILNINNLQYKIIRIKLLWLSKISILTLKKNSESYYTISNITIKIHKILFFHRLGKLINFVLYNFFCINHLSN